LLVVDSKFSLTSDSNELNTSDCSCTILLRSLTLSNILLTLVVIESIALLKSAD